MIHSIPAADPPPGLRALGPSCMPGAPGHTGNGCSSRARHRGAPPHQDRPAAHAGRLDRREQAYPSGDRHPTCPDTGHEPRRILRRL